MGPRRARNSGFTLIEVLLVIALLAILAMLAVPRLIGTTVNAKQNVDIASLEILNRATAVYAEKTKTDGHVFDGVPTDTARMQTLVDASLLGQLVSPQQDGAAFTWDTQAQCWELST